MAKIDLYDPKWVDMVFAGKNKEYGAYQLRKGTSGRNIKALLILVIAAALVGGFLAWKVIPVLILSCFPDKSPIYENGKEMTTIIAIIIGLLLTASGVGMVLCDVSNQLSHFCKARALISIGR